MTTGVCAFLALTVGCSQSPSPTIQELNKTNPVLFNGLENASFTTPITSFTIDGTCDPTAYGLQFSYNTKYTWADYAGGCPANGSFSMHLTVNGFYTLYAREKTKNGFTSISSAKIRLILPPTSPAYIFVASSNSDNDAPGPANQSSMNLSFTNERATNGSKNVSFGTVGIVYEQ